MADTIHPSGIELAPSRLLVGGIAAAYTIALVVVLLGTRPGIVAAALASILIYCAWRDVSRRLGGGAIRRITSLRVAGEFDWIVADRDGNTVKGRSLGPQLVHPWAIAFTVVDQHNRKLPVLVLPDMTSQRNFHALRLWLSLRSGTSRTEPRD